MGGYRDRTVRLTFDEYAEPGDELFIVMKNPKLVPLIEPDENSGKSQLQLSFERLAGYILDWRIYDPASNDEDQPLLPLPATGELFAKLPSGIQTAVADEVNKATNPMRTPDTTQS